MCFKVTNTSDETISVIYSQWVTREVVPEEGAMSELVLPSGLSAVVSTPRQSVTEETRHRLKVYAHDEMTIFHAASVEAQDGLEIAQLADLAEPLPEDGPL